MKKANKLEYSSDENSSPTRKPPAANNMMMNWLNKSAKKGDKEKESKEEQIRSTKDQQPKIQENKSQYFGNVKKDNPTEKLTVQSSKVETTTKTANSEKRSPKDEFNKKIKKKELVLDTDEDEDDQDDFLVNKKVSILFYFC